MRFLEGHRRGIRALAYAPGSESLLASAGDDRQLRFWNPANGESSEPLSGHGDSLVCLAFSPDGTLLASGGRSGSLVVWSVAERRVLRSSYSFAGPVVALGFPADNREVRLAVGSAAYDQGRDRLCRWDLRSEKCLPDHLPWRGWLESAAFAPPASLPGEDPHAILVALATLERTVELWPPGEGVEQPFATLSGRVRCLAFCPRGRYLALGSGRFIELWDVVDRQRQTIITGHRGTVQALAFHPDGRELLTGGVDRMVLRWQVPAGSARGGWEWPVGPINALAVSPDGLTAAVGGDKSVVVVWDLDEE
jgi:WD40 repeat protein